ncbi:MAG: carbohydrate ABC transporter permease [Bacteroidota bacterium]
MRRILRRITCISPSATAGNFILWSWIGMTVFSMLWVVMTSLKTNGEFFQSVWALPKVAQFANYVRAWRVVRLQDYFFNSVTITIATTILTLLVSAMAAYALSRFAFRGGRLLLLVFLAGMGIPHQLLLIPLYFLLQDLKLINSLPGLGLVYIATSISFSIFVLHGFFASLPSEIEEAAEIDGCNAWGVFWKVAIPLAAPGMLTVGILNALGTWNEYMLAMTFIRDRNLYTLPVGLYGMQVTMQYTADWTALFAGFIISIIPSLLIYVTMQRYITAGLTMGALKE